MALIRIRVRPEEKAPLQASSNAPAARE